MLGNSVITFEKWCNDCRERSTTWFILGYGLRYKVGGIVTDQEALGISEESRGKEATEFVLLRSGISWDLFLV